MTEFLTDRQYRERLLSMIQDAKDTVLIAVYHAGHWYELAPILKKEKIHILINSHFREKRDLKYINEIKKGIGEIAQVRTIRDLHAKVILCDNKRALIGSMNLTRGSLLRNHEAGIYTENTKIISEINAWWTTLWQRGKTK